MKQVRHKSFLSSKKIVAQETYVNNSKNQTLKAETLPLKINEDSSKT